MPQSHQGTFALLILLFPELKALRMCWTKDCGQHVGRVYWCTCFLGRSISNLISRRTVLAIEQMASLSNLQCKLFVHIKNPVVHTKLCNADTSVIPKAGKQSCVFGKAGERTTRSFDGIIV